MSQGNGGPIAGTALGVSVIEDQIASVVRGADGQVLASNLVDLRDGRPQTVVDAIDELATSVPYHVETIGIACARPSIQAHLTSALSFGPGSPDWHRRVFVTDLPAALAEVARTEATRGGVVALVDLGRDGAPSPGLSIVTVDTATGEVLGTSEFADGTPGAVTDPSGATALADAIHSTPGSDSVNTAIVTGAGAELPGVAPALEYALGRPVRVANQPSLAPAVGSAVVAQTPPPEPVGVVGPSSTVSRRWWMIGGAVAAALLLGAIAVTAVYATVSTRQDSAVPSVVTTTVTEQPSRATVTRTAEPVTETVTESESARPRETVTRESTVTRTRPGTTVTLTETETVYPSGAASELPSFR
ncbi:hypothetical protein [Gordonia soli]|uniref:Uncharacterized protein n=1 Tax=Gordonia soli NBRC 108243 TaxID=1223545 RepID=M0QFS3_9ACTN|nr:hypothetical protein [Gordonia soli]GAC67455.1 hypothetical protein GS4_08_00390 [Gordonia soli NBRC 108243]